MAYSSIQINFADVGSRINDGLQFRLKSASGNLIGLYWVKFVAYDPYMPVRVKGLIFPDPSLNDIQIGSGDIAAQLFVTYFGIDYNQVDIFTISRQANIVTITSLIDDAIFTDIDSGTNQTITPNNVSSPTVITVNTAVISQDAGNQCNGFNLAIGTNINFVRVRTNGALQNVAATNSFNQDLLRNVQYTFIFETADGATVKWPASGYLLIDTLDANNFDISEIVSFGDISARVVDNAPSAIGKEYSLNNVDWQSSPTFAGLSAQTYTLYIRDNYRGTQLGCVVSKQFTLVGTPSTDAEKTPIIEISKTNSIGFVNREDVDNINTFKNVTNSFSRERKFAYLYCDEILFQVGDSTRIQMKSSYDVVTATLRSEAGVETPLTVTQRTNNIGKFASMDAVVQFYQPDYAIIYFNSGFYYDELGAQLDPYNLNGNLPEFAVIGAKIEVGGLGVTEVVDIIYLDSINRKCLVVPLQVTNPRPDVVVIKAEYNILDYNIFDFDVVWNTEGIFDIVLEFSDPLFTTVQYQSENINVAVEHPNTIPIRYFNTNNRDIFYKYEIEHFIRVPVIAIEDFIRDEVEPNITDKNVNILRSTLNEGQTFIFEEMTRSLWTKLAIALSCEWVFINGIGYAKFEPFEIEPIQGTNLTRLKANMLLTGIGYNNIDEYIQSGLLDDIDFDVPVFNTQNLIVVRTPNAFVTGGRGRR